LSISMTRLPTFDIQTWGVSRQPFQARAAYLSRLEEYETWGAVEADKVVGVAVCHRKADGSTQLDILVTKPGRGAGPVLLRYVMEHYGRLVAQVNTCYQEFYRHNGWVPRARNVMEFISVSSNLEAIKC